jgi:hypothetical protein
VLESKYNLQTNMPLEKPNICLQGTSRSYRSFRPLSRALGQNDMTRKVKLCLIGLGVTVLHALVSILQFIEWWSIAETGKGFFLSGPAWKAIVHGTLYVLAIPWAYILWTNSALVMFANGITWSLLVIGLMELIRKKKQGKAALMHAGQNLSTGQSPNI